MGKARSLFASLWGVCGVLLIASTASAVTLDLTTPGASGSIGAAFFLQTLDPGGTGLIKPFVRIQESGSEKGQNSDGPYSMDEKSGPWTHSIRVNQFGIVDRDGVPSIPLLLDINQQKSKPLLSLDRLKVFVAPVGTYHTLDQLNANATQIYDLGLGNKILLNYALDPGSGKIDMVAYLPTSLFTSYETSYLYLFSEFGATGGIYASNAGFEEWASTEGGEHPEGACCAPNGDCHIATEANCRGAWAPAGVCSPNPCSQPPVGFCCDPLGICAMATEHACIGTWTAGGTCTPNPCPPVPVQEKSWGQVKNIYR